MRNFLCRFRHIEGIALCELCCTMHAVAAPIIFWAHKNWLHYSKMGFPIVPTISPPYLRISVDFWTASWRVFSSQLLATRRPAMWQKGRLVVVFRNVFSAKLFSWKFTPCPAIFCHSPSMTFKTPRPTPHATLSRIKSNNTKKKQGNRPCEWWESQVFNFVNNLIENRRASWSSVTPPPWLSKPHAPRRALRTD
jgi:hypothetical protein